MVRAFIGGTIEALLAIDLSADNGRFECTRNKMAAGCLAGDGFFFWNATGRRSVRTAWSVKFEAERNRSHAPRDSVRFFIAGRLSQLIEHAPLIIDYVRVSFNQRAISEIF